MNHVGPRWLVARCRVGEARAVFEKCGFVSQFVVRRALPEQALRPHCTMEAALEASGGVPEPRKACAVGDWGAAIPL